MAAAAVSTIVRKSGAERIRDFIESGRRGTAREISISCAVAVDTVYACLKRLEDEGRASRVDQQRAPAGQHGPPVTDVWGAAPRVSDADAPISVVDSALRSRSWLEIFWLELIWSEYRT